MNSAIPPVHFYFIIIGSALHLCSDNLVAHSLIYLNVFMTILIEGVSWRYVEHSCVFDDN